MNLGFWAKLKKPVIALAPMADVTDPAFRRIITRNGKPDVMWTEFVSADGIFLGDDKARKLLLRDLEYAESERPIVAQMFTSSPERMKKAAKLCKKLGFDGFDINMGCPDRGIEKQMSGAALIKHPKLAKELVLAAKEGAGDMPVSVKTRIGYHKNEIDTWLPSLLAAEPAVITFHARTRKEMSKTPADWNVVKEAVLLRNSLGSKTLIFGNGDVSSTDEARQRARESGCDGIMIGRGIFGNPWFFNEKIKKENLSQSEIKKALIEHIRLFDEILGGTKNFSIMRKHFKAYINGWPDSKKVRDGLMNTKNAEEAVSVLQN